MSEYILPIIVLYDLEEIKTQLERFETIFEKLNFLNRVLVQTNIENAIKEWDIDCLNCVKQFQAKPAWQGVFDALHGDYNRGKAINNDAYEAGMAHYKFYISVRELISKVSTNNYLSLQSKNTKTEELKAELGKYDFFELPKVKQLSEPSKQSLVELISTKGLPYGIAMLDFLDFLKHIKNLHFKSKSELNKEVAKWFNSDKDGRAVKGNIASLSDYSYENKNRYTAHTNKEKVITDYQKLK